MLIVIPAEATNSDRHWKPYHYQTALLMIKIPPYKIQFKLKINSSNVERNYLFQFAISFT